MADTPPRALVASWHPERLAGIGAGLQAPADAISNNGRSMANTIRDLDWSGDGRRGAMAHADSETAAFGRLSTAIGKLRTALTAGAAAMAPHRDNLVQGAQALEGDSYVVADDWKVTDDVNYGFARLLAGEDPEALAEIEAIRRQREQHAINETIRLTDLARQLGVDAENCANTIREAKGDIDAFAPMTAGLTTQNGQADAEALRHGKLTPAQLARIAAANNLTPEQLSAMKAGLPASIPDGEFDYLKSLMQGLDGYPAEDLDQIGDNLSPQQQDLLRGSLADSVRLMGSPNYMRAEGGQHGGIEMLPTDVRSLLTSNPISQVAGSRNAIPRAADLEDFAGFMSHGEPGAKDVGSDVNRDCIRLAAEIAQHDNADGADWAAGQEPDRVASALLGAAAQDHPAVADALGDGRYAQAAMNNADGLGGANWKRDEMVAALMGNDWGGHDDGMKAVIDGINDNAVAPDEHMATMSGESAEGIAKYLGAHPFGLNENLTQSTAAVLGNYVPHMGGVDYSHLDTRGFNSLSVEEFRNVFAAMDQYESSAVPFNEAAYASVSQLYGMAATHPDDIFAYASAAGRIDAAAQNGMNHYLEYGMGDEAQRAAQRTAVFTSVSEGAGFAVKQIPVVGDFAGLAMDSSMPLLARELFGSVPELGDPTAPIRDKGGFAWQYYQLLQGSDTTPGFDSTDPHLQTYITTEPLDGHELGPRLMTYDEIGRVKSDPVTAYDQFGQAMEHYFEKKGYDLGELNRGWCQRPV